MGSGYDWRNFKNNPKGLSARSNPNIGYLHQALFNGSISFNEFQAGMDAERASVLPMSNRAGFNSIYGPNGGQYQKFMAPNNSWGNAYNNTAMPEFGGGGSGGGGRKPPTTFSSSGSMGDDGFFRGVRPNYKPGAYSTLPLNNSPKVFGSAFSRYVNSPILGKSLGAAAYTYSLVDRLGKDPSMISNVIFPGVVGEGLVKAVQSKAFHPFLSELGKEGLFGLERVGEGSAARTVFNKVPLKANIPFGSVFALADSINSIGQAGSADPLRASLGRENLSYGAGYLTTASALGAAGIGGLAGLGLGVAGGALLGGAVNELMQASSYQRATAQSIKNLNMSQAAFSYGVAPNLPKNLNAIQSAATGVSLYLDTFMAGIPLIYGLASQLGAPTSESIRQQFGKLLTDSHSLSGQFKGMSFGQARAAYIGAALAPNVLDTGGTSTYADAIDWKGGIPTFVEQQLSSIYKDGKAKNLSNAQIRLAEIQAGATSFAALSQRAQHEQRVINNMKASAGRGLFGDYKPLKSTVGSQAVGAVFGKNAGKAFNDANNAVGSAIHGALNWATGPLSAALAQPGIQQKISKREQTISARNYAASFLAGRGISPSAMVASATPKNLAAAFTGSSNISYGGSSYGAAAAARYAKMDAERAVRERSALAEAGYRYEQSQRLDLPNFRFDTASLDNAAPHVSEGLSARLSSYRERFDQELNRGREYLLQADKRIGQYDSDIKRINADKNLTKLDKIQALSSTNFQKNNVLESVESFKVGLQQMSQALKDFTTQSVESAKYLSEQQAINLTRANNMARRDTRNDRKARLLDKRTMGLISNRQYITESFNIEREAYYDGLSINDSSFAREKAAYDVQVSNYKTATGRDFDPNASYDITSDPFGYNLKEIGQGLAFKAENNREFKARGERELSEKSLNFALKRGRAKQIERGLQPYATSFFGTLGRGGSFGDAIKSLQLPFMQDIGNLAVKGLSNLLVGTLDSNQSSNYSNQSSNSSKNYLDIATETLKVLDGDTVKMSDGQSIRIAGIDTPEKDQKGGLQAAVFLGKLLKQSKYVSLNQTGTSYGRIVGSLVLENGKDVGRLMAESGFAKPTFGRYGELSSKYKFDDPSIFRAVNKAAGGSIGGEPFPEGLVENLLTAGSVDLGPKPYFGQAYASNNTQSYFSRNGLGDIPIVNGVFSGGAAPVMGVQNATGGMGGGLANAGLLAGIGGLFKGTGGIGGMVGRFFGKTGTTSIASTLAAKGGMVGKLAGNFSKNGGMGLGSLAAAGNLVAGAVGSIAGSFVGGMIAKDHYGSTGGSIGSTVGGTVGSIIGTAFMPVIGTAIGGFLGSLLGGGIGGFFGGGSGKKAMKEQKAAEELHQKTMTVFAPKVKSIMADIDPLDWSSIEGAKNKLRATKVRGREQTSIRRAAYNDIAKMKEALLPYKDISDRPGGIAGNLFENKVRAGMSLSAYGPFSDAPASKLYDFYSSIQERLSELKPEQRSQYKQLSQDALAAQRSYLDTQLNLQISRSQAQYGFDVRGAAIESLSRGVAFDQMQRQVNNFDRDSQRSLEQVMGVTQRRGNRSKIAAELLDERGFQKGILGRNFDILQQSQSLQSDQSNFNLSTALQDINFLTESQKNLATEANKLTPIIGDVNDELLRLLSAIKDVSDALKKI